MTLFAITAFAVGTLLLQETAVGAASATIGARVLGEKPAEVSHVTATACLEKTFGEAPYPCWTLSVFEDQEVRVFEKDGCAFFAELETRPSKESPKTGTYEEFPFHLTSMSNSLAGLSQKELLRVVKHRNWEGAFCSCMDKHKSDLTIYDSEFPFSNCQLKLEAASTWDNMDQTGLEDENDYLHLTVVAEWRAALSQTLSEAEGFELTRRDRYEHEICLMESLREAQQEYQGPNNETWELHNVAVLSEEVHLDIRHRRYLSRSSGAGLPPSEALRVLRQDKNDYFQQISMTFYALAAKEDVPSTVRTHGKNYCPTCLTGEQPTASRAANVGTHGKNYCPLCPDVKVIEASRELATSDISAMVHHREWEMRYCQCLFGGERQEVAADAEVDCQITVTNNNAEES